MSGSDINYDEAMVRWEPDSRGRLEQAALALFGELGFEETTVAAIAQRAGVTERTFFRHFADKREVLFGGGTALQDAIVGGVREASPDLPPLAAVAEGFAAAAELLQGRRQFALARSEIIAANPGLQERELIKLASIAAAVGETLRARGVDEPDASLAAQLGVAAFHSAFGQWVATADAPALSELISEAFGRVAALTS
ncbi:MAG TPA: helix-turn-helix domain-containing protein [Solirubrobacteraceae bacterium]|jgi:AcrR family transcriptional regulator